MWNWDTCPSSLTGGFKDFANQSIHWLYLPLRTSVSIIHLLTMALVEREGPSQNIVKYRPVDTKLANNWLGSVSHSALPLIFIPKPTPDVRTIFATLHWENNRFTTHSDSWSQGGSSPFYLHHENHQAKWFLLVLSVVNNILPARILCPTQMEWRKTPRHSSAVLFIVWNISDVIPARSDKIKPRRPYKLEVLKGLREISQCLGKSPYFCFHN